MLRAARLAFLTWLAAIALASLVSPSVAMAVAPSPLDSYATALIPATATQSEFLTVRGILPLGSKLPAVVAIPVPTGATPSWVGEILGGDPSKDPTATYTLKREKGYDLLLVTAVKSLTAQAEFGLASAPAGTGPVAHTLSLHIPVPVGSVKLVFQLPQGAKVSSLSAGLKAGAGPTGFVTYSVDKSAPKVGSVVKASLTDVVPASAAAGSSTSAGQGGSAAPAASTPQAAPSSGSSSPIWTILIAAATALLVWNVYKLLRPGVVLEAAGEADEAQQEEAPKRAVAARPKAKRRAPEPVEHPQVDETSEDIADSEDEVLVDVADSEDEVLELDSAPTAQAPVAERVSAASPAEADNASVHDEDIVVRLKTLAELHLAGELTDEEFVLAKLRLFGA